MSKPKSAIFARFKTDKSREEDGVWVDFGGFRAKIRRFKSRASQDALRELQKPHADVIRRGPLPEDVAEDILVRQMARAIIVDWEDVTDEDGNPLPCNENAKYEVLKALPDFRDEVFAIASQGDNYRAALNESAEGNS